MKRFSLFVLPILTLSSLLSCGSNSDGVNHRYEVYSDVTHVETSNFSIQVKSLIGQQNSPYDLRVVIEFHSFLEEDAYYTMKNVYVKNESLGTTHDAWFNEKQTTIDTKIFSKNNTHNNSYVNIWSETPTSIHSTDRYFLVFTISDIEYKLHLYETPDSLRKDCSVNLYLDNELWKTLTVKERRTIAYNDYLYSHSDHRHYCDSFYDKNNKRLINQYQITENTDFYGKLTDNFVLIENSSCYYIDYVAHIPTDGVVVFPSSYNDKPVWICKPYFKNNTNVKEIYFPKGLSSVVETFFDYPMPKLKKVHFEGTEEEFKELFNGNIPSSVEMIYNTIWVQE